MDEQREEELAGDMAAAIAAAAEAQQRIADAQEAHNKARPDLRIHALAYAIQSFAGRECETSEIAIRAEAFFLFLADQRGDA